VRVPRRELDREEVVYVFRLCIRGVSVSLLRGRGVGREREGEGGRGVEERKRGREGKRGRGEERDGASIEREETKENPPNST
jgi:hypothetical protein